MQEELPTQPVSRRLPVIFRLLSVVLLLVTLACLVCAPVFHADLGEYMPATQEELDELLKENPDAEEVIDRISVDYSALDIILAAKPEADLDDEMTVTVPNVDGDGTHTERLPVVTEPVDANNFSNALSVMAFRYYLDSMKSWVEGGFSGDMPVFDRHADNLASNYFLFDIMIGFVVVGIGIAFTIVGVCNTLRLAFGKKLKKKRDMYVTWTVFSIALFIAGMGFFLFAANAFAVPPAFSGMAVLPVIFGVLAVVAEIAYKIAYSRLLKKINAR